MMIKILNKMKTKKINNKMSNNNKKKKPSKNHNQQAKAQANQQLLNLKRK